MKTRCLLFLALFLFSAIACTAETLHFLEIRTSEPISEEMSAEELFTAIRNESNLPYESLPKSLVITNYIQLEFTVGEMATREEKAPRRRHQPVATFYHEDDDFDQHGVEISVEAEQSSDDRFDIELNYKNREFMRYIYYDPGKFDSKISENQIPDEYLIVPMFAQIGLKQSLTISKGEMVLITSDESKGCADSTKFINYLVVIDGIPSKDKKLTILQRDES